MSRQGCLTCATPHVFTLILMLKLTERSITGAIVSTATVSKPGSRFLFLFLFVQLMEVHTGGLSPWQQRGRGPSPWPDSRSGSKDSGSGSKSVAVDIGESSPEVSRVRWRSSAALFDILYSHVHFSLISSLIILFRRFGRFFQFKPN